MPIMYGVVDLELRDIEIGETVILGPQKRERAICHLGEAHGLKARLNRNILAY